MISQASEFVVDAVRSGQGTPDVVRYKGLAQVRLIATKELGDRLRSGWVVACMLVWLGAICLTSFFGLIQIGHIGAQGYERTVSSLLNLVQYVIPLLGLLVGHDLIVSEVEERSLKIILTSGVSRSRLLLGKFVGGSLTLALPLLTGFFIAGMAVGVAAHDHGIGPFVRLAWSALGLGILFLAMGLTISVLCRSRVRALVVSLLAWCFFVFVFDLVGLSLLMSTQAPAAAREIEIVCDTTHVNAAADVHSALETVDTPAVQPLSRTGEWLTFLLALNPVDTFRVVNLGPRTGFEFPLCVVLFSSGFWLALPALISFSKFRKSDL